MRLDLDGTLALMFLFTKLRRWLLWFLWALLIFTVGLGIASARLADEMSLVLLETETAPHPEPWPRPRTWLVIGTDADAFDFSHPRTDATCEVTWEDCPGHRSCVSKAEALRRQRAWRENAAQTLRLYGWTVIEPPKEDQQGEVRTTVGPITFKRS